MTRDPMSTTDPSRQPDTRVVDQTAEPILLEVGMFGGRAVAAFSCVEAALARYQEKKRGD
jgi:hypothetical protein